jgi:hypothetical protein
VHVIKQTHLGPKVFFALTAGVCSLPGHPGGRFTGLYADLDALICMLMHFNTFWMRLNQFYMCLNPFYMRLYVFTCAVLVFLYV